MQLTPISRSGQSSDVATYAAQVRENLTNLISLLADTADDSEFTVRSSEPPVTEQKVRMTLAIRRKREKLFQQGLFGDPAWDILLELYAADLGQRRISVSSACIGAAVPATTALRWIKHMENEGLITRREDPMDGRRVFLSLSEKATQTLDTFFRSLPQGALGH